jgi:uncharacterized protein (DUF1778 family)
LTGATVNQFLVQAALKEAQAVIEREDVLRLSPRDWSWLLDVMGKPPRLNAKLLTAVQNYNKLATPHDAGTAANWQP